MARGYSSARQQIAAREDSFGNTRRRRDYSSCTDQRVAEKAIRAERVIGQTSANEIKFRGRSLGALHGKPQSFS